MKAKAQNKLIFIYHCVCTYIYLFRCRLFLQLWCCSPSLSVSIYGVYLFSEVAVRSIYLRASYFQNILTVIISRQLFVVNVKDCVKFAMKCCTMYAQRILAHTCKWHSPECAKHHHCYFCIKMFQTFHISKY